VEEGASQEGSVTDGRPRRRILVVDDQAEIVDVLRDHFESSYDIDSAGDGKKALARIRKHRPDLIVLDIRMPGVSGIDVLKTVKQNDPTLPVIVLTGNEDTAIAAEAVALGAFSYVPKPFDFDTLDHLVAIALGG
jgi:two-component system, response regulator, stage 0 sporulation protein F